MEKLKYKNIKITDIIQINFWFFRTDEDKNQIDLENASKIDNDLW